MRQTELKYWVNGYQVRGGFFHTYNFNIGKIGVMVSWIWDEMPKGVKTWPKVILFRLI